MAKMGALLTVLLACGISTRAQQSPSYVTVRTEMMDSLLAIADTATVEHGACLAGAVYHDSAQATLYVLDATVGAITTHASAIHVNILCPRHATLAVFHNHILREFKKLPLGPWNWKAPTPAAEACQLSRDDLVSAMLSPVPLTVVGVDQHTFCWWYSDELRQRFSGQDLPIAVQPDSARLRTDWKTP